MKIGRGLGVSFGGQKEKIVEKFIWKIEIK